LSRQVFINWKARCFLIKIVNSGFYTSIQDSGRIGYYAHGVPISGVMDAYSAKMANALLGNDKKAAVMEITMTGPTLLFDMETNICITGAQMNPMLNDTPVALNHIISVQKNDILSFGKLDLGFRTYIAVSGGFQTEEVMESRSMYKEITSKSCVQKGDVIKILPSSRVFNKTYATIKTNNYVLVDKVLEVFEGPEFHLLTKDIQKVLGTAQFTVSKNNNRMGYQLEECLKNNLQGILTGPVLPGTVQLTPSGKLIVLMRDGQTTGGYPRVLQLKEASINVFSQKRTGDIIKFQF